jgi:hypothetical protein
MVKSSVNIKFERKANDLIWIKWRIRKIAIEGWCRYARAALRQMGRALQPDFA